MDSSERTADSSTDEAGQQGFSGKRVTVVVVLLLVLVGIWLGYSLWVYDQIDRARATTEVAWRALVEQLDQRYRKVEGVVAEGVDDRTIEMQAGEKFRLAIDRFRTTAQPTAQYAAARELEQQLAELNGLPVVNDDLKSSVETFNACLREERDVLGSLGGRFLSIFLEFADQQEFSLST